MGDSTLDSREFDDFLEVFPGYKATTSIDSIRAKEFSRLDKSGHVYLDYTGGGLYAESQVLDHEKMMVSGIFGNPHSSNPTSKAATEKVEETRAAILRFFNADPNEYTAIFTSNASGALKLVGESYEFKGGRFLLAADNHNSVNGIRNYAAAQGAEVTYVRLEVPELTLDRHALEVELSRPAAHGHNLFAYPAQSNFTSVKHPMEFIELAQRKGWDVLLDAAAFAPTSRLDLGVIKPDYVPISFYKIFGYPTGLGVLLVRNQAMAKLRKPWFSGGTVVYVSVNLPDKYDIESGSAGFEDGTINYLGIPAIKLGLDFIDSVGYDKITERVRCLTAWTLSKLHAMQHSNGKYLVQIYGPITEANRGGAISLNLFDKEGRVTPYDDVERRASLQNISLRTGCFCNPGVAEIALSIDRTELDHCITRNSGHHMSRDNFKDCFGGSLPGAVRVSIGWVSNFSDVQRLLAFIRGYLQ